MNKLHIAGAMFLLFLISSLCVGQTPDITSRKIKLKLSKVRVSAVLAALAVQSEVSIGFERSDQDGPDTTLNVDETQSTVKELLDHC